MKIRSNQGMTIVEVAVSASVLALLLLGVADFSAFTSKANKANNLSDSFSTTMSTIDGIIKSTACDVLFGGLQMPSVVGQTRTINKLQTTAGFAFGPPAAPPAGYDYGRVGEPASIQLTYIQPVDTVIAGAQIWEQRTMDLKISLTKVSSLTAAGVRGPALPGNNLQSKDYTLNLWVIRSTNTTIPTGTCTYKKAAVLSGPIVAPTCTAPNSTITATWSEPLGSYANIWGNFSTAPTAATPLQLSPNVQTFNFTTPNSNQSNMLIYLQVVDTAGNVSPTATSLPVKSFFPPTVSANFIPTPNFTTASKPVYDLNVVTTNVDTTGGAVKITAPITYALPVANGTNPNVPVNITASFSGQSFPFTVVAQNGCGVSSAASTAIAVYSNPCAPTCGAAPLPCASGTPYNDSCGSATCSCPACNTSGCGNPAATCSGQSTGTDSCGNACPTGTLAGVCDPVQALSCVAPLTFTGTCNAVCNCTGAASVPSPTPTPSPVCSSGAMSTTHPYTCTGIETTICYGGDDPSQCNHPPQPLAACADQDNTGRYYVQGTTDYVQGNHGSLCPAPAVPYSTNYPVFALAPRSSSSKFAACDLMDFLIPNAYAYYICNETKEQWTCTATPCTDSVSTSQTVCSVPSTVPVPIPSPSLSAANGCPAAGTSITVETCQSGYNIQQAVCQSNVCTMQAGNPNNCCNGYSTSCSDNLIHPNVWDALITVTCN